MKSVVDYNEEMLLLASARPKKRAGRRIFKETRHPVYRGVRRRNNDKWVCEVRVPNDKSTSRGGARCKIWLGTYPTPEMAARAHDVAVLALRGKSACLNFADSAWRLPLPASTNPKEIKRVAAEAAKAFAVVEEESNSQRRLIISDDECDACSSSDSNIVGMEADALQVDVVPAAGVSEQDMHEYWFRSMVDEPLRSPLPFTRCRSSSSSSSSRDHWNDNINDLDVEVSLWSFTI